MSVTVEPTALPRARSRLRLPPSQNSHRPQSHPARRLAWAFFQFEPDAAFQAPVERPGASLQTPETNVVDCFAEPWVWRGPGESGGRPEIVEGSQDVVAPS